MTLDKFSLSFKNKNHTVTSGFLPSKMRLKPADSASSRLQHCYSGVILHTCTTKCIIQGYKAD